MTPLQRALMTDARIDGGLAYTVAGWRGETTHSFVVAASCERRGWVKRWDRGHSLLLTSEGLRALEAVAA